MVNEQRAQTSMEIQTSFVAFIIRVLITSLVMLSHWDFLGKRIKIWEEVHYHKHLLTLIIRYSLLIKTVLNTIFK